MAEGRVRAGGGGREGLGASVGGLLGVAASLGLAGLAFGQTVPAGFTATSVATGLSSPTSMAVAPDGSVYIAQQGGLLRVWSASTGTLSTVATFPTSAAGERGLIGVALDPAFASNRYVYVTYSNGGSRVARVTLDAAGTGMVAGSETMIVELTEVTASIHNGGALHFGPDGMLYVAVGDSGNGNDAQSAASRRGKLLRYRPDGTIPDDNPAQIAGIAAAPAGIYRAIWAAGLRNPFTFAFQPGTGRVFINDVGGGSWEEINEGMAGANYGWPRTEGRFVAATWPDFTNPVVAYAHGGGTNNYPPGIGTFTGSVITGGTFYDPARPNFPVAYRGQYFFADFGSGFVRTFDPASNTGAGFATGATGVVDLDVAPDGTLLILSRNLGLRRVTYTMASGACCSASGACTLTNGIGCEGGGGTFVWGAGSCTPVPCAPAMGACCLGAGCMLAVAADCAAAGGRFVGDAVACNAPGDDASPCCRADFDNSGVRDVADIFGFLSAWFAGDPRADIDGLNGRDVGDIFAFLSLWFGGC